jgi:hypothetical protein
MSPCILLISIDIGSRNLAIRVEPSINNVPQPAVLFDLVDLAPDNADIDIQTQRLTHYLKYRDDIFRLCSELIVEQQRIFKRQFNNATMNIRLLQHIFGYFQMCHPAIKRVEIPPTMKTPRGMTRKERKEYAIQQAFYLLQARGDFDSLQVLRSCNKIDDLADTVVQLDAYRKWCTNKKLRNQDTALPKPTRRLQRSKKRISGKSK